jgi:NAD/NADP transhydrogenase beta subunit
MITSVASAAIGFITMITAAFVGASGFILAMIYIASAVPTLILVLRAMLEKDSSSHFWSCEVDECFGKFPEERTPSNKAPLGPVLMITNSTIMNGDVN